MTDHKFTDDEIIKAYELCFTPKGTNETCAKCPFHKIRLLCKIERDRAGLALMNRQKAEIEKLNDLYVAGLESLRLAAEANKDMQAELNDLREIVFTDRTEAIKKLKAEAIKEFAERLKVNTFEVDDLNEDIFYAVEVSYIDYLVKEMTEDRQ